MFIGKYYHHLEEQGRLSLPKKFRQKENAWIITRGLDGCLFLLPAANFENEIKKIADASFTKKTNRDLLRLMTNEATELAADEQGRVYLPKYLIEFARLEKAVVVVGSYHYLEIWDQDLYHRYVESLENQAEQIAENLNLSSNQENKN